MTDAERRTLRSYLTECLEPRLKTATEMMEKYAKDEETAETFLDTDFAAKMSRFYRGQVAALTHAIDDFKELFEEDLKEGE